MKRHLRDQFRGMFAGADKELWSKQCRELEEQVIRFCLDACKLRKGNVVTLFGGLRDEVDLVANVMMALVQGGLRPALFGLPVKGSGADASEMQAYLVDNPKQTKRGRFGVWEPEASKASMVPPGEITAVLVPGLFFSEKNGARLGRGGGFFDRYLARTPESVMRVGVGLECQLREGIPLESHDQSMDWLVTNERIVSCR
jgi:5-formyltetrahydrofolate cyclo-ligase